MRAAIPFDEAVRAVWRRSRGSREEVLRTIEVLRDLGTLTDEKGSIGRSASGDRLSKALARGDNRPLGMALIEARIFHEQGRVLFEAGRIRDSGHLECPGKVARRGAAQLLAVLELWPEVQTAPLVLVPPDLVVALDLASALPPPSRFLPLAALRKELGDRAELLTYLRERTRAGANPSRIAWVAKDSDTLGWDVEDRSVTPLRRIEVKGSQNTDTQFYLSENEFNKAREHGESYEIQFWGGIDLEVSVHSELRRLTEAGYPRVYKDPAALIDSGHLLCTPVRWRVRLAEMPAPPPGSQS